MRMVHAPATSIILSCLVSSSLAAQESPTSVEDLGRGVFDALAGGSLEAFVPYLMTAEDFEEMVSFFATAQGPDGSPGISEAQRAEVLGTKEAFAEEMLSSATAKFQRSRDAGYDWPSASFVRIEVEVHTPDGDRTLDTATLAAEDHRGAQISVVVSLDGDDRERTLNLRDCFRTNRGWVIAEDISLLLSSPH